MAIFVLLSVASCNAQLKNQKTETVKIYGNCGMCKETIEKAGTEKKVSTIVWDKNSKMATINYDSTKTNKDAILKKIAYVGYDSDTYLAPDDTYNSLHSCCQYDRGAKKTSYKKEETNNEKIVSQETTQKSDVVSKNQLTSVFDNYFKLKDELIKSNSASTAEKSKELSSSLEAVNMKDLTEKEHVVWMKVMSDLKSTSKNITATIDIETQRTQFIKLSNSMYELLKVSTYADPVYLLFCPMANNGKGANWLSKESQVKNPYYGSAMLSCGSVKETIK